MHHGVDAWSCLSQYVSLMSFVKTVMVVVAVEEVVVVVVDYEIVMVVFVVGPFYFHSFPTSVGIGYQQHHTDILR